MLQFNCNNIQLYNSKVNYVVYLIATFFIATSFTLSNRQSFGGSRLYHVASWMILMDPQRKGQPYRNHMLAKVLSLHSAKVIKYISGPNFVIYLCIISSCVSRIPP